MDQEVGGEGLGSPSEMGARGQLSDEPAPPNLQPSDFKTREGNHGDKRKGGERKGYFLGAEVDETLHEEAEHQGDWKPAWGTSVGAALWPGPVS